MGVKFFLRKKTILAILDGTLLYRTFRADQFSFSQSPWILSGLPQNSCFKFKGVKNESDREKEN